MNYSNGDDDETLIEDPLEEHGRVMVSPIEGDEDPSRTLPDAEDDEFDEVEERLQNYIDVITSILERVHMQNKFNRDYVGAMKDFVLTATLAMNTPKADHHAPLCTTYIEDEFATLFEQLMDMEPPTDNADDKPDEPEAKKAKI